MFGIYFWQIFISGVIFFISINFSNGNRHFPCEPLGTSHCECMFPSGMGVNLTLLKGTSFNVTIKNDEFLLFYPCENFSVKNVTNQTSVNECEKGVSVCLENHLFNETKFYDLGSSSESHFEWTNVAIDPILIFDHPNRKVNIQLKCIPNTSNLSIVSVTNDVYNLVFSSEHACATAFHHIGRSVLSAFLIIFLVLFSVYMFGGFLVLWFIRGARGWEAIPNGEFWKSSSESLKNVCLYFMNGCRHPGTYDTI